MTTSTTTTTTMSDVPVWVPLVFLKTIFLWSFAFYTFVGVACRVLVKYIFKDPKDPLLERKRDTVGRWMPSLIHASIASVTGALAIVGNYTIFDNEGVIMHSLGYFIGDLVVDHDPGYIVHHLGPVMHAEVLLRLGAKFWHTMKAGWWCELGNVFAHTAAVLTYRRGATFHAINTYSFWISRPASYYDGFMAWYSDLPYESRWTLMGIIPLLSIIGIYHANTKWMIQMCRNRDKNRDHNDAMKDKLKGTPTTTNNTTTTSTTAIETTSTKTGASATSEPVVAVSPNNSKKLDSNALPDDVRLQPTSPNAGAARRSKSRRDNDA